MKDFRIVQIPAMQDNYFYVIQDRPTGKTAVMDPGLAGPVIEVLEAKKWNLDFILNTHHHPDHVGGNLELKRKYNAKVVGSKKDQKRIPDIEIMLEEGDFFELGQSKARVLEVDGHTIGHIAYHFEEAEALFCGDAVFSMGCGRLFEGTSEQMWKSLKKISNLPKDTLIFCAHEYTIDNANFALSVDEVNEALLMRIKQCEMLRLQGKPTIPTVLATELETNPFFRILDPDFRNTFNLSNKDEVSVFAELRRWKDHFRSR